MYITAYIINHNIENRKIQVNGDMIFIGRYTVFNYVIAILHIINLGIIYCNLAQNANIITTNKSVFVI